MRVSSKGRRFGTPARRAELLEVLRHVGPGDECIYWPWANPERTDKYANVHVDGKSTTAHRWVFEQINGPLGDLDCAHECDTPLCVRPSHLKGITHGQNLADAYRRGRKTNVPVPRPGEAHPNARLSDGHIRQIRRLVNEYGVSHSFIAEIYGIGRPAVSKIARGLRWSHVAEAEPPLF